MSIYSQPAIEWQKCLGGTSNEEMHSVIETHDGGFILAGMTQSNDGDVSGDHGTWDVWLVKLNSTGDIQWQKCLGGSQEEWANCIIQTVDSGFAFVGITSSIDGDVSGYSAGDHVWIVKTNPAGQILWQKYFDTNEYSEGYSIIEAPDKGLVISSYDPHARLSKLSYSGEVQWQRTLGGTGYDELFSIINISTGGYALAGHSSSTELPRHNSDGNEDAWIVKCDDTGGVLWQKCYGGSGDEMANSIIETDGGGFAFAGFTSSKDGDVNGLHGFEGWPDAWVVKLNDTGGIEWQKCLGGPGIDVAKTLIQTSDGGFIVACSSESYYDGDVTNSHGGRDFWIVKLDALGNIDWQKSLGGSNYDDLFSAIQTRDGAIVATGFTRSNDVDVSGNHGGADDAWVVKLNSNNKVGHSVTSHKSMFYPNPFISHTSINFNFLSQKAIILVITDQLGREVWHERRELSAGQQSIDFDGSKLPAGTYYYEIRSGADVREGAMVIER